LDYVGEWTQLIVGDKMKIIKNVIIILILFSAVSFAQQQSDDLQKVKDALVNQVLKTQDLEKQNANLNTTIQRVAEDLKKVKTIEQLDSLKTIWGIAEDKIKADKKK
jgi:cell shape-determining protein MreC